MAGEQKVVDGEIVDDVTDDDPIVDDVIDDDPVDDDPVVDDDEETKTVEPWMQDEDDQQSSDGVPVSTHIRMKQKLKRRLLDRDDEVDQLRKENEALKAGVTVTPKLEEIPKRPRENDFDTVLEFETALDEFENRMVDIRLNTANKRVEIQRTQVAATKKLEEAVDSHYSRAAKLIQDNGIDTEVYKKADLIVREAVETLHKGKGDLITDQIILTLGEGSEKVLYYLGRNKNALNEFKSLLTSDASGLRAAMFLGQQKERLLNSKRKTSRAPVPDSDVKGDDSPTSAKASTLLKKRKAAVKAGNIQLAYDIKKQAKAGGVDVSTW